MHNLSLSRLQGLSRTFVALIATSAVFTAGCANMTTTAIGGSSSMSSDPSISGKIHGGLQPVAGATVKLWFAGESGPTSAYVGATTTTSTDGGGSFHFVRGTGTPHDNTYVCPKDNTSTLGTNDDPMVYLVATGGDTINSTDTTNVNNNLASVFVAPLGDCNSLPTGGFIDMSETVTVATMAALQQFFNPNNGTFFTDGTGQAKYNIQNAFNTIPNLVDVSTGTAVTAKTLAPAGYGLGHDSTTIIATPESGKINTLANILASCINNASATAANCSTLFSEAKPPSAINASTTALGGPNAMGAGATFPVATDVLRAVYYMLVNPTDGGTSHLTSLYNLSTAGSPFQPVLASAPSDWTIAIAYSSVSTCNSTTSHLIRNVQDLAVDTYGNIWIANNETNGNLSALSPSGQPVSCVALGSGANTGVTIDSFGGPQHVSYIWVADNGSSTVYRYHPTSGLSLSFPTANPPKSIAADGSGNVYFTSPTDSRLYEIPGAVAASAAVTPVSIATGIGPNPAHMMVDSSPAIWATSGSTFVTRTTVASPTTGTGASSIQLTAPGPTYGIAVGSGANLFYVSADGTNNLLDQFQGSGTAYSEVINWPVAGGATPAQVAIDGAQNIWTIDNAANSVVEVGAAQQSLSPAGGFQKASDYLGSARAIVVDGSGNVWIGLEGPNTSTIAEIVGAAVPVYQPYSTALKGGLFQTIP